MLHTDSFLAKKSFDTAENEPSKVIFLYFLIPQILKSKFNVLGSLFNGLVVERRHNSAGDLTGDLDEYRHQNSSPSRHTRRNAVGSRYL
jgi:hypothetical protein